MSVNLDSESAFLTFMKCQCESSQFATDLNFLSLFSDKPINEKLQYVFKKLNNDIIKHIDVESAIDSLFGDRVLSADDNLALSSITCRRAKARKLLALLHAGQHPEAFLKLYQFLKTQGRDTWLIEKIDAMCVNGTLAASVVAKTRKICEFCCHYLRGYPTIEIKLNKSCCYVRR